MIVTFDELATIEAEEATPEQRTIRGTAVPWNKTGTVSDGTRVKFLPGSLDAAARPIVTLGHDGAPIGKVSTNTSSDTGMATAVKVSRTRDGDEALVLAADGVLAMFSVGVNPTEFTYDDDGTLVVAKGEWHHTALLPFGAFSDAVVTDVAASAPPQEGITMSDTAIIDTEATPPEVTASPQQQPPPAVIPVTAAKPAPTPMTLERIATLVASANRGEIPRPTAKATIEAALQNILTTNIGSIVQPAYVAEITGLINHGTPLFDVLGARTLPASGNSIEWPQWVVLPQTGIQTAEKTPIVSQPASMTMKSAPVIPIAGGNDISIQAVERSSPSFLTAYLEAMAADWAKQAEDYVLSVITPLATVVPPGADWKANVAALLGALTPAVTPAGPLFLAISHDVWVSILTVTNAEAPALWTPVTSLGTMVPGVSFGGLPTVIDPNLPAGTMLAGSQKAVTVYTSAGAPADIRVVDVSLLGLDVGVYGYVACAVAYPNALAVMTIPAGP